MSVNNFTASFKTVWAKEQQEVFYKKNVAMEIADTSFNSQLTSGQTLQRTYRSSSPDDVPWIITRWANMSYNNETDTAETLTVNRQFGELLHIHDFDKIQNNYDAAANYWRDYAEKLKNQVDSDVLGEVVNAANLVDARDVWGTAWQGITMTSANILNIFTASTKKLAKQNVTDMDKVWVISPEVEEIISLYYGAKVTDLGDKVSENGYFTKISWYKLFTSNSLTGSAVLALATNPSNTETVTIQGQVFTFVSSIGTTAGNVLIGGSADATRANLAALINAPQTTTANGVALTWMSLRRFQARATAANDDTANTLTVTFKGAGTLSVSETLSAGADVWTAALQKQLCVFGVAKKCTTLVMQRTPDVKVVDHPERIGVNIQNGVLYGTKTFADNAKCMVRVEIASSTF